MTVSPANSSMPTDSTPQGSSRGRRRRTLPLWILIAVCVAPVIASYLAYYVFDFDARSNHGELIEPQRDVPAWSLRALNGEAFDPARLRGKWTMVSIGSGACDEACAKRLFVMRQVRATTGKERDRVERVWIATDARTPRAELIAAQEGLRMLRADDAGAVRAFFDAATDGQPSEDFIYMIDPLGHLMMRWPKDVDPKGMIKDVSRLLRASRIG